MTERPEGPDEGLREQIAVVLRNLDGEGYNDSYLGRNDPDTEDGWRTVESIADAVLPLLTAERERADALQRQVEHAFRRGHEMGAWTVSDATGGGVAAQRAAASAAMRDKAWKDYQGEVRAALSRTATERLPHADVSGLTPETCPQRDNHGSPFRFCPVKGCGWHEGMQR